MLCCVRSSVQGPERESTESCFSASELGTARAPLQSSKSKQQRHRDMEEAMRQLDRELGECAFSQVQMKIKKHKSAQLQQAAAAQRHGGSDVPAGHVRVRELGEFFFRFN